MAFDGQQANDHAVTTIRGGRGGSFRFAFFSFSKTSIAGGSGV